MAREIRDIIDTPEKEQILFKALEMYENKCRSIGNSKIMGHGKVTELDKKRSWLNKADEIRELTSEIAGEFF